MTKALRLTAAEVRELERILKKREALIGKLQALDEMENRIKKAARARAKKRSKAVLRKGLKFEAAGKEKDEARLLRKPLIAEVKRSSFTSKVLAKPMKPVKNYFPPDGYPPPKPRK